MKLKPVYMNIIDLQNKIHHEFQTQHGIDLTTKELNEIIEDYINECQHKPTTTWKFISTYLDQF